ncbi:hypothetical protein [Sorangium sp. So ce1024]|uniref:hypothetical protein n=1 Tax=Sorangium sp. So ce1024 TaxID=3133327 RepID=UPI003F08D0EC
MKSHRVRIPTFARFERLIDCPPRYAPPPTCCDDCGCADREHERWCPRVRGVQAGAHHIGSVHATAPGEARCAR